MKPCYRINIPAICCSAGRWFHFEIALLRRNINLPPKHAGLLICLMIILSSGCANEPQRKELDMTNETSLEDGLNKLEQAAKANPGKMDYRADFVRERERAVNHLLRLGDQAREQVRPDEAESYYQRVLRIDADNSHAKAGVDLIAMDKRHDTVLEEARTLFEKNDFDGAQARLQTIFLENPTRADALALKREIDDQLAKQTQMAMPSLQSKIKKPVSLQFRDANLKMVFEALSRTSGINVLLDRDVRSDIKTTIFVKDASVEDTINLILMQSQLGKKVLNENTIFVYPNTPAKIKEYQELVIRTFHLTNADAKQMQTMIKTMLKTKDIFIHEKTNSLVMRDTPEAVQLAEKLVAAQDLNDPEVMLEVEILEVLHSKLTELGVKFPTQAGFSVTETPAQTRSTIGAGGVVVTDNIPAAPLTVEGLRHIKASSIHVTPLTILLNLKKEIGDTNLLANPRIRVRQHEKAKIMIGDRVPVITNSVTPVSTGTPVVTGSVQYLDVGLKLEVEPDIHMDGEVAIKTYLEVSSITSQVTNASSGTIAYQIGTRNATTVLRLADGETQVLAGLISDEERKSVSKVPGLGDLPLIGRLFASHNNDKRKTEIILSITPHIVRNMHRPEAELTEFWSGTDSVLQNKPLTLQPVKLIKTGASTAAMPLQQRVPAIQQPLRAVQPLLPVPAVPSVSPAPAVNPAPAIQQDEPAQEAAPAEAAPVSTLNPASGRQAAASAITASATTAPLALSWQGATQAKVGEPFKLALQAQAGAKVAGVPLQVAFDPAVLEVLEVTEGDFLNRNNVTTAFSSNVDAAAGQIAIGVSQPGQNGSDGAGGLVNITFRAIAAKPQSSITVSASNATDASGQSLPVTLPAPHTMELLNP